MKGEEDLLGIRTRSYERSRDVSLPLQWIKKLK
jgi:hypothetical protein